ncbi:MAG: ATP-binding protein [Phycisphaerae bacterium]
MAYEFPDRIRIGVLRTKSVHGEVSAGADHEGEHWHTIEKKDLSKHALIVGSTGSGKTQTTLFLARELFRVGVPFTIIEPAKTEYFDRLAAKLNATGDTSDARLRRFNFESDPVQWCQKDGRDAEGVKSSKFLPFDPMRLQKGVSVARHVSYLKSCFEAAFPLTPPLAMVLETGIRRYYTDPRKDGGCGLKLFQTGGPGVHTVEKKVGRIFPSLQTFTNYFCGTFLKQAFPDHGRDTQEVLDFFRRRFDNLTSGLIGEASRAADACLFLDRDRRRYEMFSLLLTNASKPERRLSTIIELDGIPDAEQKALVMAFLMTFLFEYRQAEDMARRQANQDAGPVELRHVLILEEAHRLLANSAGHGSRGGDWTGVDSQKKAVSLFTDMLAEMRAYGQGIVIVEQIPTKIIPEAVKNTNLRIMLRLTSKDDRDFLGDAMNLTEAQKLFVTGLTAKEGRDIQYVVFEEGIDQPRLLTLPLPARKKQPKGWLFDEHFNPPSDRTGNA